MQKKNAKQMQQKKLTNATKEAIKCNNRSKPQTNTTKEANKCNNRSKQKKQATKASKLLTGAVGDGVGASVGLGVGAAVAGVGAQMPSYWRQYWNGAAHQLPAAWQLKSALPQLAAQQRHQRSEPPAPKSAKSEQSIGPVSGAGGAKSAHVSVSEPQFGLLQKPPARFAAMLKHNGVGLSRHSCWQPSWPLALKRSESKRNDSKEEEEESERRKDI